MRTYESQKRSAFFNPYQHAKFTYVEKLLTTFCSHCLKTFLLLLQLYIFCDKSVFFLQAISTLGFDSEAIFKQKSFYLSYNITTKQHENNQFLVTDTVLGFAYLHSHKMLQIDRFPT